MALRALFTSRSPSKWWGLWMPGVSTSTIWATSVVRMARRRLRVVWATGDVIATFSPTS